MISKINKANKILLFNILGTVTLRGFSVLISFFTTPGFISYFNNASVLGIWFTVLSILNWIMMFDLGIGNGLRNRLAKSIVNKNTDDIRKQITSAYMMLGFVSFIFLVLGELLIYFVDWNLILNISSSIVDNNVLKFVVAIIYGGIILQFWLKLISSILLAMQKNVLVGLLLILTNIVILIFLYLPNNVEDVATKLINLSIVYVLAINIPLILVTIYLFFTKLRGLFPSPRFYNKFEAKSVFFIIQLSLMAINSTNEWLITFLFSSNYVVDYQIYYRIFNLIMVLFALVTQPIWSSITIEYEKGNIYWIKKVYRILNIVVMIFVPIILIISLLFDPFINLWLGSNAIVSEFKIVLLFAIFTLEMVHINASTCIANGTGKLKCQFYILSIGAILKFPITFFLSNFITSWEVVLIANIIILLPMVFLQPMAIKEFLKRYKLQIK